VKKDAEITGYGSKSPEMALLVFDVDTYEK
jgi:hypothetical protein